MALIIAGDRSGVGKTTFTLALLSFLSRQGSSVQSFKVGPDYIDPMFHTAVTNRPCRNLDPVLTSPDYVQSCFTRHSFGVDFALIEGVMGLFDGINYQGLNDFASTAHISRILNLPVLLVMDCSRLSGSVAAIASGYSNFDPQVKIAGLVLNRVGSDRHLELLTTALEPLQIPILGILRRQQSLSIPDRHLGLFLPSDIPQLNKLFEELGEIAANCCNWEQLFPLLKTSRIREQRRDQAQTKPTTVNIGIASDRAFNFYYQDNLDILQELGAKLIPWSPLTDTSLPPDLHGLYFPGGYPEIYAQELAENQTMAQVVKKAINQGIPTYAECGGLMYLCEQLIDFTGKSFDMVGILPTTTVMGKKLTLGYRQARAIQSNFLVSKGEVIWGHEFHRSSLTSSPTVPLYQMSGSSPITPVSYQGWTINQVHASYLHVHFGGYQTIAKKFILATQKFSLLFF